MDVAAVWPLRVPKVLTHKTNPDQLVPSTPSPTSVPPLRIADRYVTRPKHG